MNRLVRNATVVFLLASLLPTAGWTFPSPKEKWIRAQTENFRLIGNVKSGKLKEMALQLEQFRAVLGGDQGLSTARSHLPTTIIVFKNDKSYRPYRLNPDGQPDSFVGKFVATSSGNYISLDADAGEEPFGIIFHEYVHYFLSMKYETIPLWLNEGIAEFYSTFWIDNDKVEIGRPLPNHVRFLGQQRLMRLGDLFAMDANSKDYNEGVRQGIFYAQSWAYYHYLYFGGNGLLDQLGAFLEPRNPQISTNEAFKAAFHMDYEPMEQALREYVAEGSFNYLQIKIEDLGVNEQINLDKLPYAELLYVLGDYLRCAAPWRGHDAIAHLREAIRLDPSNASAHSSLAAALEAGEQIQDAERHYHEAMTLGPDVARVQFLCGQAKVNRFLATEPQVSLQPSPLPAVLAAARPPLERCIELNPNWGEAYVVLGNTYLFDPQNVQQGIALLRYAWNLMPSRYDVVYGLIVLNIRDGNHELAEGLTNQVLVRCDSPEWIESARSMLEYDKYNRQLGQVNAAIDQANAGQYTEAIGTLDRLTPQITDPQLKKSVRKLLSELRAASNKQKSH